jgi:hypothetical protein
MTNPSDSATGFAWSQEQQGTSGLSKREYFSAMALQGLLSIYDNNEQNPTVPNEENVKYMAKLAVQAADAIIAELNKKPNNDTPNN